MGNMYQICSLLMATLFVISAFAQFNDQEWYFWITLYAGAAYVNLMNIVRSITSKRTTDIGNITLCLSQFLLSKVLLEHLSGEFSVGISSIDMRERLVREKFGGALVAVCMILQISAAASFHREPAKKLDLDVAPATKHGMAILVAIWYGLSTVFLIYHRRDETLNFRSIHHCTTTLPSEISQ